MGRKFRIKATIVGNLGLVITVLGLIPVNPIEQLKIAIWSIIKVQFLNRECLREIVYM